MSTKSAMPLGVKDTNLFICGVRLAAIYCTIRALIRPLIRISEVLHGCRQPVL